jgi:hypothetical protein
MKKTTDLAQIVFTSRNECPKETTLGGKVLADKENLRFTVIDSFSAVFLSTLLLAASLRVFMSRESRL